jgi:heme oxygenase
VLIFKAHDPGYETELLHRRKPKKIMKQNYRSSKIKINSNQKKRIRNKSSIKFKWNKTMMDGIKKIKKRIKNKSSNQKNEDQIWYKY